MSLNRRAFLIGAGAGMAASAMPFDLWRRKRAQAAGMMTRYSTASPEGAEMLAIYAEAVAKMKALPPSDPYSWVFQWYTHWVDGTTTKSAAIESVFGSGSSPERDLAEAMWDTCQGHGPNPVEYFVVWHRMFVFYFEEIIRVVSGEPAFTLPYWPYNEPSQLAIPAPFRDPGSPLYVADRNAGVNDGVPIDEAGGTPLSFDCMEQPTFLPASATQPGFNAELNQNPHGVVHDDVGTLTNMGMIPYAAKDPVFYAHHCQVDRLWASWNAAGGQNIADETWMSQSFTFVDGEGNAVTATNRDFLDTAALGYRYDTLMEVPPIQNRAPMVMAKAGESAPLVLSVGAVANKGMKSGDHGRMLHGEIEGALSLGPAPLSVDIPAPRSGSLKSIMTKGLAEEGKRFYLVLNDVYAAAGPGTGFGVYVNLPKGTAVTPDDPHYVGSINFFNATAMPGAGGMFMTDTFVLDITDELKTLQGMGAVDRDLSVTIAPFGPVKADSAPKVGRIDFVVE